MSEVITDAIGTELLFENDQVRVWSMSIEPGEASPVHRHTRDWLYVYVTDDNRMETRFHSGRRARADFDDGYVGYDTIGDPDHPDLTHALHNVGAKPHRQILVEFKDEPGRGDGAPDRVDNGRRHEA
jgi:beta-alanine degradation protein BauB